MYKSRFPHREMMETAKEVASIDNSQKVQNLDCSETPFSFTQFRRRPLRSRTSEVLIGMLSHFRTNLDQLLKHEGEGIDLCLRPVTREKESNIHNESDSGALHSEKDSNCQLVHQAHVVENEENKVLHSEEATAPALDHINIVRDAEPFVVENQTSGCVTKIDNDEENVPNILGIKMDEFSIFQELDSVLDLDMASKFSKDVEMGHDKSSVAGNILTEVEHELQLKEVELEKLIYDSGGLYPLCHPNIDEETEEGEIPEESGDVNALSEHAAMILPDNEQNVCKDPDPDFSGQKNGIVSLKSMSKTLEHAIENPYLATIEEDNDISKKKRKRGPQCKERKEKKKKKERIKRAKKNREDGVKRLKLPPALKPKTREHCRHYIQGRCHQGDKCNFSHDVVPSTKNKPCGHFARNSCMKGDDCPYDHQLSKYPCKNYTSTGLCSRGSNCKFSHEISASQSSDVIPNSLSEKRDMTPEISAPKLSPSLHLNCPERGGSSTVSMVTKPGVKSSYAGEDFHCNSAEPVAGKPPLGTLAKTPKGVSFLSDRETSFGVTTSMLKQYGSSVKPSDVNDSGSINKLQANKVTARVPKGVNFLSFTQPSDDSSTKMFPDLDTKANHGKIISVLREVTCSSGIASAKTNNQCASSSDLNVKGTGTPLNATKHATFLALDRTRLDDLKVRANFRDGVALSFRDEEGHGSGSTLQPSITVPSTSVAARSSDLWSSNKMSLLPSTSSPVQKAISSTLSFASKLEANMKTGAVSLHHLRI